MWLYLLHIKKCLFVMLWDTKLCYAIIPKPLSDKMRDKWKIAAKRWSTAFFLVSFILFFCFCGQLVDQSQQKCYGKQTNKPTPPICYLANRIQFYFLIKTKRTREILSTVYGTVLPQIESVHFSYSYNRRIETWFFTTLFFYNSIFFLCSPKEIHSFTPFHWMSKQWTPEKLSKNKERECIICRAYLGLNLYDTQVIMWSRLSHKIW